MIVSKPKPGSLFSLGVFSTGGIIVGAISFKIVLTGYNFPWYHYLISLTLFPLAIAIFFRIFWTYKVVEFGKGKVDVNYPFRFRKLSFPLSNLSDWKEINIKNKTGQYKEIEINYNGRKITLNNQEHSHYREALQYMNKKASKIKSK